VEAFYLIIKCIHITLEVKTSFGNSTPAMGSSTESSYEKYEVSTDSHHRHRQKEEKENMHTKNYKAKLKHLRSARLIHCDKAVRLLDMQRIQVVKDT
jgi:hypothetical protein